jgi:hypothetical protein
MKNNRRNFLKITGLTGLSLAGGSLLKVLGAETEIRDKSTIDNFPAAAGGKRNPVFNMSGYAAPKLEKVRIGFIGLGKGESHVSAIASKAK